MRILLDTNVLVSGMLVAEGASAKLLQAWLDGFFELVSSEAQLQELARVLTYPRICERIDPDQASIILDSLATMATLVAPGTVEALSGDPDDDILLAVAIAARADLIVSGDRSHVLPLGSAGGFQSSQRGMRSRSSACRGQRCRFQPTTTRAAARPSAPVPPPAGRSGRSRRSR